MCLGNLRSSRISRALWRTGTYEPHVTRYVCSKTVDGMVVLDVGAHIGYYTLLFAKRVGASGRVIAFEPDPDALRWLRANVALNGHTPVTVCPFALGQTQSRMLWQSSTSRLADLGAAPLTANDCEVETRSFDQWAEQLDLDGLDMVKIDVEGAELEVLLGMRRSLHSFHPTVIVELHPSAMRRHFGRTVEELFGLMRSLRYECEVLTGGKERIDGEWAVAFPRDRSESHLTGFGPDTQDALQCKAPNALVREPAGAQASEGPNRGGRRPTTGPAPFTGGLSQ
jgi:FkbM family methyltransferase